MFRLNATEPRTRLDFRPIANELTVAPLPAVQKVDALFSLRVDRVPPPSEAQLAEEKAANAARAALSGTLVAMNLLPPDANAQIDLSDAARLVLILHLPNAAMQRELCREHIAPPSQLNDLLAARPELAAWGSRDQTDGMLPPAFWGAWADFVRLEQWNLDKDNHRVASKKLFASLQPRQTRVIMDTGDFADFVTELEELLLEDHPGAALRPERHIIRRHALLLYVVRCCLLHKNGRMVLELARFDWLGPKGRELVWQWIVRRKDPALDRIRVDDGDFLTRLLPVQRSISSLLHLVTIDLPVRQTVCPPSNCVLPAPAVQPPPRENPGEPLDETPGEPPLPPPREEDASEAEAAEVEQEASEDNAAAPAEESEPVSRRIGVMMHACAYHDRATIHEDGFCARACLSQRLGSHIAAAAHPHVASSITVRAAGLPSHCAQQVAGGAIVDALAANRPRAREALLRAHGLRAPTGRVNGANEWATLTRAVEHVGASAQLPDDVDAMASACGWRAAPAGERLARYVAAYGAGTQRDAVWRQRGWAPVGAEVSRWLAARPVVPLRTLQAIAYVMQ